MKKPCFMGKTTECVGCEDVQWEDCEYGKLSDKYVSAIKKEYLQVDEECFVKASSIEVISRNLDNRLLKITLLNNGWCTVDSEFEKPILKWFKERSF